MANFKLEDIPKNDLQALGLYDGKDYLLDKPTKEALLNGHLTNFLHFKDLKVDGVGNVSLDAKLSLRKKADGSTALSVHPIYKEQLKHPNLTPEEAQHIAKGGTLAKNSAAYGKIVEFGAAPYQFDDNNKQSFYIRLEKANGQQIDMWGVDLERALQKSGHQVGDMVQLVFQGTEKVAVDKPLRNGQGQVIGSTTELVDRHNWEISDYNPERKQEKVTVYEFDAETNSFVSIDQDNVIAPDEVNGIPLSPEQKREFREGKKVALNDGTEIQASPASKNGLRSNKKFLIVSLLLDGGISFALYHGVNALMKLGNKSKEKQVENEYNKGYMDALRKVQIDLERKQQKFPNDPSIASDLNLVKQEVSRVSGQSPEKAKEHDQDVNNTKARVNDPELERNAQERKDEAEQQEKSEGRKR